MQEALLGHWVGFFSLIENLKKKYNGRGDFRDEISGKLGEERVSDSVIGLDLIELKMESGA